MNSSIRPVQKDKHQYSESQEGEKTKKGTTHEIKNNQRKKER
jgi:hypothetical protein